MTTLEMRMPQMMAQSVILILRQISLVCFLEIKDANSGIRHFRFVSNFSLPDTRCLYGSPGNERGVLVTVVVVVVVQIRTLLVKKRFSLFENNLGRTDECA